jgi:hypothetical protein
MDANETAVLLRQLEHVKARTFDVKYPALKARQFIPVSGDAAPGAETITYRQWNEFSMAKIIANYADDLPLVDVAVQEFVSKVHSLGKAYNWSIQDLRRSAMAGAQLDVRRATAARRAIERTIDEIAAFGDADGGLGGFLNNANVTIVTLPTAGAWTGLTPAQIIENMNFMAQAIIIATLEVHIPDTMLFDTTTFSHIAQTPIAVDNQTTILQSFLANNPYIRNIDQWTKLNLANAAGNGPRAVTYMRDPEILSLEIPQEFEQFPPQNRNLSFVVPCHARVGGVIMYYPLALNYTDFA